ncbi:MAG: 30S ribosome-binding factor RbfA [Candidatus Euphemobacter frigidus]|nr:30S ribosome-binding factor RbfA [Candidatus Euphemobacter frigidus]MDP8276256.1 30S ribosome-binding factor RbfA [Candidatus Euphemobacter frigidus]
MKRYQNPKNKSRRQCRMEEQVKRILGEIMESGVNDPRIGFVSVVGVEMTGDLKMARVYVSFLGGDDDARRTLEGLRSARSYLQRELGHRMSSRYTPVITFFLDDSTRYSDRINHILNEMKDDQEEDEDPTRPD